MLLKALEGGKRVMHVFCLRLISSQIGGGCTAVILGVVYGAFRSIVPDLSQFVTCKSLKALATSKRRRPVDPLHIGRRCIKKVARGISQRLEIGTDDGDTGLPTQKAPTPPLQ